jgi:hypothetical protein
MSYRLVVMFLSAPANSSSLGRATFVATTSGLAVMWLASLTLTDLPTLQTQAVTAGAATVLLGLALYLADMTRLYRARRQRALELHGAGAIASLVALGIGIALLAISLLGIGSFDTTAPAAYLLIFGWLSGLALSQLYKLVPFLTWLHRYSRLLGRMSVPGMEDLTNERRAAPWFILYFAAVALGTGCGLLAWPILWRMAIAMHFLATLGIVQELWRTSRWPSVDASAPKRTTIAGLKTQHGALE